ncbi:FAD-binding oxidoreductase [Kordiimonas sp. SCSIO 12610]|uniref:FAD-binding oxidoreductase n=1 Tax=Kordiimonas sp. SCSIO 12610 TaxID=2829597 RepID=UPI00210A8BA2|nr:FAD-binding oxidoreductase [Kordiimonas sp. SCSIO 12610]UTW56743.1 FAD-binding oxidoreductase [Kordiimonas sp. SCSIO 12610]
MISEAHIHAFYAMLDSKSVSTDQEEIEPHLHEWRDKFKGSSNLLLKPSSVQDVSRIVKYCNEHSLAIVPQGGNTGLVGGGIAGLESKRAEIILSTKRIKNHIAVDDRDYSITADAGYTVAELETEATRFSRHFPLSLASEGSCTLGGIISTNAGGVHVVRYGTTRDLILGIEAVLPNGEIFSDLSTLRKDNTGYDLKQLLIGAEGTLGIITKASMKLVPVENNITTAWIAVQSAENALDILSRVKEGFSETLSAFEIMPLSGINMVLEHIEGTRPVLEGNHPWYILLELGTSSENTPLQTMLENKLADFIDAGLVEDAVIAKSISERADFWKLRESMSEAQKHEGGSIKHDISVPVAKVPEFLNIANEAISKHFPDARPTPFGHLGDGNLHYNIMQPKDADKATFLGEWQRMNEIVHDITVSFGGSISAEHGIGTLKKGELSRLKPATEIAAMRAIKQALDPNNIMNPGALFI